MLGTSPIPDLQENWELVNLGEKGRVFVTN
jgi:hypothetical protein